MLENLAQQETATMTLFTFLFAFAVIALSSAALTRVLEKIGSRWHLPEAVLGLITALGTNSAEISSSIFAIYRHHHDLGLGIILGSNIINLAGLMGLGAVIAGRIEMGFQGLLMNGGANCLATAILACLIFGFISPWESLLLLALVMVPYIYLISQRDNRIQKWKIAWPVRSFLVRASEQSNLTRLITKIEWMGKKARPLDYLFLIFLLAIIISGSFVLVHSAVILSAEWHISHAVVGALILAGLTSVPNIISAILLAREGRGAAVISVTFNSNTLNILTGVCLPVLIFGMKNLSQGILFSLFWLSGMTAMAMILSSFHRGMRRFAGSILLMLYFIYGVLIVNFG